MEQVTCALVFSVVKEGLTWLFHETWEAKASAQEHSVHFVSFPGLSSGPDGTQNKQHFGVTGA